MTPTTSRLIIGFTLTSVASMFGCSSGLDRSKAAELISKKLDAAKTEIVIVSLPQTLRKPEEMQNDTGEVGVLTRLGYVECQQIPPSHNSMFGDLPGYCQIVLTDKGKKASSDWGLIGQDYYNRYPTEFHIPVAKRTLVEVTGVTIKDTEATATYTWKMKPINEIGEGLVPQDPRLNKGQPQAASESFRKFDDGWRIAN